MFQKQKQKMKWRKEKKKRATLFCLMINDDDDDAHCLSSHHILSWVRIEVDLNPSNTLALPQTHNGGDHQIRWFLYYISDINFICDLRALFFSFPSSLFPCVFTHFYDLFRFELVVQYSDHCLTCIHMVKLTRENHGFM